MIKEKHITPKELFNAENYFQFFKVKNRYYKSSSKDGKTTFVLVSKKDVEEQLSMSNKLAEKLKDNLDANKVLVEVFMTRYSKTELDKLYKYVFKSKKKYKAKTREGHCVDMKVGNAIIPLVDG